MRKTLALAIACAMLASMSSVAFADTTTDTKTIKVDETSAIYMLEDEDSNVLNKVDGSNLSLEPGDSFFIEILPENAGENIPTKLAGQYKVVTDWQTGKSSFESASITTKKVAEATGKYITKNPQYGLAASYDSLDALKAAVDAVKVEDNSSSSGAAAIAEVPLTEEQKAAVIKTYTQEFKTDYKYVAQINTKASYSTKEVDLNGTVKADKDVSDLFMEAAAAINVPCKKGWVPPLGGATDSAAFAQAGFRATGVTGLNHKLEDYYHTRRDTYDNMNKEGLAGCFAVSVKALEMFDNGAKQ